MSNEYGLDVSYFRSKLQRIIRDIDRYTPDEAFNEFCRMAETAKPTPRKPFDINEHEWSDYQFQGGARFGWGGELFINASEYDIGGVSLNKADAIAIAKALGVTGEDLK